MKSQKHLSFLFVIVLLVLGGLLSACQPRPSAPAQLTGGVLATFDVEGEEFQVWVTNPESIQQLFDLQAGTSSANIPNGRILRGPGEADHNTPWSWHLDPQDIEMAEITIELCDGMPSFVEENLDEFVNTVERYCPWAANLTSLEDFRTE
jgi:hypothetical protein